MNDHVPCCEKSWRELAEIIRTSVITINEKSGGRQPQSRLDGSVTPGKPQALFMFVLPSLGTAAKPGVHKVAVQELWNPGPLLTTPREKRITLGRR